MSCTSVRYWVPNGNIPDNAEVQAHQCLIAALALILLLDVLPLRHTWLNNNNRMQLHDDISSVVSNRVNKNNICQI